MKSKNSGWHKIRPAARIIHTIGSDLVGDAYAALVELVKNSYDADATNVIIKFKFYSNKGNDMLSITVSDNGHGMAFETIINQWLVPASDYKLRNKVSPKKKRELQGRKGIGRFASAILGQEMTLCSIDELGVKSTVVIDWRLFWNEEYLDDINILVEKEKTNSSSGTHIEIIAENEPDHQKVSVWNKENINTLIKELRQLTSPFNEFDKDEFNINISFYNCPVEEFDQKTFDIEPLPIIDLYDYRISGKVNKNGSAILLFENHKTSTKQIERIEKEIVIKNDAKYCGDLEFDFRVFDRDPESIENIINKGLIDPITGDVARRNQTKRMLNEIYGVNVYKNRFRIRPYGNKGVDWLDLDKDRIQNPSQLISNNQIVGFVTIQNEELSGLQEKSARDGLKENEYFEGLKEISRKVLSELERKRFVFRKKALKGRKERHSVNDNIEELFSFNKLSKDIEYRLEQFEVQREKIEQIKQILKKEEDNKAEILENIKKTIAIYQDQATLGKIVNILLHEGRKPLQFFNSESRLIANYLSYFIKSKDESIIEELLESGGNFQKNSRIISDLFKRVSPLASQRRANRKDFVVYKAIKASCRIFHKTFENQKIMVDITCDEELTIFGWEEDLFVALTNLLENSAYWLSLQDIDKKLININAYKDENVFIEIKDNGPGLTDEEIDTEVIFEPGYTQKLNGTGLGLAIAGEAIQRLNGRLKAIKSKSGAFFQIEISNQM